MTATMRVEYPREFSKMVNDLIRAGWKVEGHKATPAHLISYMSKTVETPVKPRE
jgi:hypothetical protein